MLRNGEMDALFRATMLATEEAIINTLVAAETMTGQDNHKVIAAARSSHGLHEEIQSVAGSEEGF